MAKHSKEGLRQVAVIAGGIWLEYGAKQTKWSKSARVPYETLERLRVALENAGFDMIAARKRYSAAATPIIETEN